MQISDSSQGYLLVNRFSHEALPYVISHVLERPLPVAAFLTRADAKAYCRAFDLPVTDLTEA